MKEGQNEPMNEGKKERMKNEIMKTINEGKNG